MGILAALVLVVASIIGLFAAPSLFIYLRYTYPLTWWAELTKLQTLAGASVALSAASLGTLGVLLTIWNQRRNLNKQLCAQRQEQNRSRFIEMQQVASAFIGEIGILIESIQREAVRPTIAKALQDIKNGSGPVPVTTVRMGGKIFRYYDNNPGRVGLFAKPLPETLTSFYTSFEAVQLNLDRYSDEAELIAKGHPPSLPFPFVNRLLETLLRDMDFCIKQGTELVKELQAIRDAPGG